jgi:hypothetical protein
MADFNINLHRRIPIAVMEGRYQPYYSVPQVFLNELMRNYLLLVSESYKARSFLGGEPNMNPPSTYSPHRGQEDDYGNSWEQLKPKTYRMKQKLKKGGGLQSTLLNRLKDYGDNPAAKSVLDRYVIRGSYNGDNINIRTGELLASFYPPIVVDGTIVPGPDQWFQVSGIGSGMPTIEFQSLLSEKEATCEKFGRPIIPSQEQHYEWVRESIEPALEAAEREFDNLLFKYGHTRGGPKSRAPKDYQMPLPLDLGDPKDPKPKERMRGPKRYKGPMRGQMGLDFGDDDD